MAGDEADKPTADEAARRVPEEKRQDPPNIEAARARFRALLEQLESKDCNLSEAEVEQLGLEAVAWTRQQIRQESEAQDRTPPKRDRK